MATTIDYNKLLAKQNNSVAAANAASVPEGQKLSAEEFVSLIQEVKDLRDNMPSINTSDNTLTIGDKKYQMTLYVEKPASPSISSTSSSSGGVHTVTITKEDSDAVIKYQIGNGPVQTSANNSVVINYSTVGSVTIKSWVEKDGKVSDEETTTFTVAKVVESITYSDIEFTTLPSYGSNKPSADEGSYTPVCAAKQTKTITYVNETSYGSGVKTKETSNVTPTLLWEIVEGDAYTDGISSDDGELEVLANDTASSRTIKVKVTASANNKSAPKYVTLTQDAAAWSLTTPVEVFVANGANGEITINKSGAFSDFSVDGFDQLDAMFEMDNADIGDDLKKTFKVLPNSSEEEREGEISIMCKLGSTVVSKSITFTQQGANISFGNPSTNLTYGEHTNQRVAITPVGPYTDFSAESTDSMFSDIACTSSALTYKVNANTAYTERTGKITIKYKLGTVDKTKEISVKQAGKTRTVKYGMDANTETLPSQDNIDASVNEILTSGIIDYSSEMQALVWIALPSGKSATIVSEAEGRELNSSDYDSTQVGAYTLIYMTGFLQDKLTITIN